MAEFDPGKVRIGGKTLAECSREELESAVVRLTRQRLELRREVRAYRQVADVERQFRDIAESIERASVETKQKKA